MKLRIKGNSIRLRLTQTEVQRIADNETVQEAVSFGSGVSSFTYALQVEPSSSEISAGYRAHTLHVILPSEVAQQWANSDRVSIETTLVVDEGEALYVLVEKDFQCLHQRPHEDEQDHFPHPTA